MSEWISVEDRLPEERGFVMAYHYLWGAREGYYQDHTRTIMIGLTDDAATHWMPLPEPPESAK